MVNGKTPEQIKEALCICTNGGCQKYKCIYEKHISCTDVLMNDALELIKRLELQMEDKND